VTIFLSRFWPTRRSRQIATIIANQEKIMATLQEVLDAEAQAKSELDTIALGVTDLIKSNADLAAQLAAAIAANDPAQFQAALDAANAIVSQGQTIIASLPQTTPTPAP
jgi:flagellar biosynthesis/type III secretory pathway chaperone